VTRIPTFCHTPNLLISHSEFSKLASVLVQLVVVGLPLGSQFIGECLVLELIMLLTNPALKLGYPSLTLITGHSISSSWVCWDSGRFAVPTTA
jgi:hypothetical protein